MSYEPTVWKAGDVVTSAKLNKLENGVAETGALIVNVSAAPDTTSYYLMDKTYSEIKNAWLSGARVIIRFDRSSGTDDHNVWHGSISGFEEYSADGGTVRTTWDSPYDQWRAATVNDYPSCDTNE